MQPSDTQSKQMAEFPHEIIRGKNGSNSGEYACEERANVYDESKSAISSGNEAKIANSEDVTGKESDVRERGDHTGHKALVRCMVQLADFQLPPSDTPIINRCREPIHVGFDYECIDGHRFPGRKGASPMQAKQLA